MRFASSVAISLYKQINDVVNHCQIANDKLTDNNTWHKTCHSQDGELAEWFNAPD